LDEGHENSGYLGTSYLVN